MDGQVFDYYDEVPTRPHQNCRCYVEVVSEKEKEEEQDKNQLPQEESCDCWDEINALVEETNEWQNEIEPIISELDNIVSEDLELLYEIKDLKQQVEILKSELSEIEPCGDNCVAYLTGMAVKLVMTVN